MNAWPPSERAPLIAVTVAPAWARAVAARCMAILNLPSVPAGVGPGAYVAVCAGKGRDDDLVEWFRREVAICTPPEDELPTRVVVAVGRLAVVSEYPAAPQHQRFQHFVSSPWYWGPVTLWLEDVVTLPASVPCELRGEGEVWQLPPDVQAQVRAGYGQVVREDEERWTAYRAKASGCSVPIVRDGLKERVLKKCAQPGCTKALVKCSSCQGWKCSCTRHVCGAEARP
ncbi:hypothetical protein [Myxococcus sp. CA040A]|uniref:hypothetical protein n=1 Tax=Myxococcus sp. CA040A TaxID=2741738 RepID=UPI00157AD3C6|nr:hypothetical protein [Myxococcus sp. CA040A]NTX08286.1 hypothetical protein [Myxococcus sp. CA040A]